MSADDVAGASTAIVNRKRMAGSDHALAVWLVGGTARDKKRLAGYRFVEAPEHADVALVLPDGVAGLCQRLCAARRRLIPVIDFTGEQNFLPWAAWRGGEVTPAALARALEAVEPIVRRLRELPDVESLADATALTVLALAYSRQAPLQAHWDFSRPEAVDYPLLTGIDRQRELLEELALVGLLARERFDRIHLCPGCSGSRLNVREECLDCRSSNLSEVERVHHYHCAYQAPEAEFVRGRSLVCPKCRRELRHYGVDYDKPGTSFVCGACGSDSSDPVVGFLCTDCGRHTPGEQISTREWWHYTLTPDGVSAVQRGILPRMSLEANLVNRPGGYAVRDFVGLLRFQHAQVTRYKRPLAIMTLRIANIDTLADHLGGQASSRIFALLVDIVAQMLRQSDAVTARGDTLYMLLPETEAGYTEMLGARILRQADEAVSASLELVVGHHDADDVEHLLKELVA